MGYNKRFHNPEHITRETAINLIRQLRWLRRFYRIYWKNVVINDHVRGITEVTPNPLYFVRSLFRSYQAFADPEEIENVTFTKYYVAKYKKETDTIEIIMESPPDKYADVRTLYLQHGGVGNWCK